MTLFVQLYVFFNHPQFTIIPILHKKIKNKKVFKTILFPNRIKFILKIGFEERQSNMPGGPGVGLDKHMPVWDWDEISADQSLGPQLISWSDYSKILGLGPELGRDPSGRGGVTNCRKS